MILPDRVALTPALLRAVVNGQQFTTCRPRWSTCSSSLAPSSPLIDDDTLRETLRKRYGEHGLIELAYAIASSRIPPTVKRGLGYAKSCSLVAVEVR